MHALDKIHHGMIMILVIGRQARLRKPTRLQALSRCERNSQSVLKSKCLSRTVGHHHLSSLLGCIAFCRSYRLAGYNSVDDNDDDADNDGGGDKNVAASTQIAITHR